METATQQATRSGPKISTSKKPKKTPATNDTTEDPVGRKIIDKMFSLNTKLVILITNGDVQDVLSLFSKFVLVLGTV